MWWVPSLFPVVLFRGWLYIFVLVFTSYLNYTGIIEHWCLYNVLCAIIHTQRFHLYLSLNGLFQPNCCSVRFWNPIPFLVMVLNLLFISVFVFYTLLPFCNIVFITFFGNFHSGLFPFPLWLVFRAWLSCYFVSVCSSWPLCCVAPHVFV